MNDMPEIRKSRSPEVRNSNTLDIAVIIRAALDTIKRTDFRASGLPDLRTRTP